MKTHWTSNLKTEEDKEEFRNYVRGSKRLLERQNEIIDDRLKAIDAIETSVEIYKQPGWEGILAHYRGAVGALKWVRSLNTLDPQEQTNERTISAGQQ